MAEIDLAEEEEGQRAKVFFWGSQANHPTPTRNSLRMSHTQPSNTTKGQCRFHRRSARLTRRPQNFFEVNSFSLRRGQSHVLGSLDIR